MNTKLFKLTTLLMAVSMLMAACGPAATATEAPTAVPPTKAATTTTDTPAANASAIDCMGAKSGDELTLFYQWSGSQEETFNSILKNFVDACGVKISAQSSRDNAVLDAAVKSTPPDVLMWPNLTPLKIYSDKLLALDTIGANKANYASYWFDMGSTGGKWVAIPVGADVKSIIWYSPTQFTALNYSVPTTWTELDALVEKMKADGNVPWSMGEESGAATGWTGSDFIQDTLLVTKGPDYVNKIISGEIPYNDPAVLDAYTIYSKWASDPKYTVGGSTGTVSTKFLDAVYKVFSNPPEAMMVKQSGFAGGEVAKQFTDLKYGTDYDFFQFPGVQGLQGGADFLYAFSDKPAAKALVAYLTSDKGGVDWAKANFEVSPNKAAAGNYTDVQMTKLGDMLANAKGFTFDMGDAIGSPFSEAEWKAVVVAAQAGDMKAALDAAAAAQAEALKK